MSIPRLTSSRSRRRGPPAAGAFQPVRVSYLSRANAWSAAALYRIIERDGPTILFDEAQHFLKRRPEDPVRGILLAGFTRRLASVDRCVGESSEVHTFSTFAPKVMNGRKLAGMDDMLTSRSVVIPMTRAIRNLPELRADRDPVGEDLKRQCAR